MFKRDANLRHLREHLLDNGEPGLSSGFVAWDRSEEAVGVSSVSSGLRRQIGKPRLGQFLGHSQDVLSRRASPMYHHHSGPSTVERLARRQYGLALVWSFYRFNHICFQSLLRKCGNSTTSRIVDLSVNSIVKRSTPVPNPPHGGIP